MAKQGEIDYLRKMGEAGVHHAIHKPFSDPCCHAYLLQMGAIMSLLPPPPARLLDVGCGTGWTSIFFAKRGYDVVGVDIAPDMIYHANDQRAREDLDNLQFLVRDYEDLDFDAEFDAAVFYDALHHAMDEELAIRKVYEALKPGGVCITSEPGTGHSQSPSSIEAMHRFNVTEKDMPPPKIIAAGRKAGFSRFAVYPHAFHLGEATYNYTGRRLAPLAKKYPWVRRLGSLLSVVKMHLFRAHNPGLVVMVK
jgi:SAM-dependent methyltransferase